MLELISKLASAVIHNPLCVLLKNCLLVNTCMSIYRYNLNVAFPFALFVAAEQLALGLVSVRKAKSCHKKACLQATNCQHDFIMSAFATCKRLNPSGIVALHQCHHSVARCPLCHSLMAPAFGHAAPGSRALDVRN